MNFPEIRGILTDYRVWTVNEVPYGRFPAYGDNGPATVPLDGWSLSYQSMCKWLSSPEQVAQDDGKITLGAHKRVARDGVYGVRSEKHPLDGTKYDSDDDAHRAAYEAGILGYMVYVKDEERFGITQ